MKFKLKIGTAVYTVQTVPHLLRDKAAYGMTEYCLKLITLDEDLMRKQPALFVQTLLHEVNHAALHEHGIRIEDRQEEELIVDSIAMQLTLLRQNKTFMKIFQGEFNE